MRAGCQVGGAGVALAFASGEISLCARPLASGQAAAAFSALDPFGSYGFETTTGNWLVVRAYDATPTNVFPWSQFWTQISALSLSNVTGRLAAVASKSNGSWQVTLFGYL